MSDFKFSGIERSPLPDTKHLQASIIEQAEVLPQYSQNEAAVNSPRELMSLWHVLTRRVAPITLCLCFVIAMGVTMNNWSQRHVEIVENTEASLQHEEFDWQEIMLIEDEWLLAEL